MSPDFATRFIQDLPGSLVVLDLLIVGATLCWVSHAKREPLAAIAGALTVILVPFLGAFLFFLFGSQSITRRLAPTRRKKSAYKKLAGGTAAAPPADVPARWDNLARLAHH